MQIAIIIISDRHQGKYPELYIAALLKQDFLAITSIYLLASAVKLASTEPWQSIAQTQAIYLCKSACQQFKIELAALVPPFQVTAISAWLQMAQAAERWICFP